MIIVRTPYRVSFFGGGTDFPSYYNKFGGSVVGMAINKYCYISLRELPNFFEHKYRFVWSKIENVKNFNEITHPSIGKLLNYYKIKNGLEIHYDGDLPARSGIGSSSSFTTGVIKAIHEYKKIKINKYSLAKKTINFEQNIIKENVGSQDQIFASYGGFNQINFNKDNFKVNKLNIETNTIKQIERNMILVFTGKYRNSGDIEKVKINNMDKTINHYHNIKSLVYEFKKILKKEKNLDQIGYLLNEYWNIKKSLTNKVNNDEINKIYNTSIENGALGGKICGSGGGGFLLMYANPKVQKRLKYIFRKLTCLNFKIDDDGCKTIFKA